MVQMCFLVQFCLIFRLVTTTLSYYYSYPVWTEAGSVDASLKNYHTSKLLIAFTHACISPSKTNGNYMDERYFDLFDKSRNLLPIMSIEKILFTERNQYVILLIDNLSVRGAYYENCKRSRRAKK